MHAPVSNATRRATYVDRTGKQPPTPQELRIDSTDAVKLAKFFVALGLTVEKQSTPEGRQYVLAKATNLQLSIFPSRTAKLPDDWNMTLIVDDAAAAAARAEASGGTIAGPLKDIPGGKKCVVASWEGHRVVVAQLAMATKPSADRPVTTARPMVAHKPVEKVKPISTTTPFVARREVEAASDFIDTALVAEATTTVDDDPLSVFDAPPAESRPQVANAAATNRAPKASLFQAPAEYYEANIAKDLKPKEARLLDGVKLGARIMAIAMFLPLIAGLGTFVVTAKSTSAVAVMILSSLLANILFIVGKAITISRNDHVVDTATAVISLAIDILSIVATVVTFVLPKLAVFVGLVSGICGIASPLLFLNFLGQVAKAVRHEKLAFYSLIVMRCLLGCLAAGVLAIPLALWEPQLGALLMIPAVLVGLAGVLLYIGLIIGFALVQYRTATFSNTEVD